MDLYLDTSNFKAILKLRELKTPDASSAPFLEPFSGEKVYEADLGREMAEKLLGFIEEKISENKKTWEDLTSITFLSGPGSFTGLRIGASIVNTLAHELKIPLFDQNGEKHEIILPNYGRPANVSAPRK